MTANTLHPNAQALGVYLVGGGIEVALLLLWHSSDWLPSVRDSLCPLHLRLETEA